MKTFIQFRFILAIILILSTISIANAQYRFIKSEHGSYYDNSGAKHTGIVYFRSYGEKIEFQADSLGKPQKLSLDNIQSIVFKHRPSREDSIWGVSALDSFVVLQPWKDKCLAKYVTTLQGVKIFGNVFTINTSPDFKWQQHLTATEYIFVENGVILNESDDKSVTWKDFYSGKFSNYPDIVAFIQHLKSKKNYATYGDIYAIVKYITHHYPPE
ncbi:MAG TPA: hypothetical protein VHC47_14930 [Mucilaginibacter sp.]|nr:hypothetical protein [Mucilaginibacter sp.]